MNKTALIGLTTLAVLLAGGGAPTRARTSQIAPGADVPLEIIQVRDTVYVIAGAGGNVTVHLGSEGAILVDSGEAVMADRVLAAVRAITKSPIRMVINTSADLDHVGGNAVLAAAGRSLNPAGAPPAPVLAHEGALLRLSAPSGQQSILPFEAWPTETYTGRTSSWYLNDDGIQVMRATAAHSDGDSFVFFRRVDVIATGDLVDLRRFPEIDAAKGGSIQGEIDALNRLLELAIPAMPLIYKEGRTLLVPGHGRISDHADLVEYRDMVTVIRDIIKTMVDKQMTLAQVQAANPTQGYRARYGSDSGPWTTEMFVEAVYKGLTSDAKASAATDRRDDRPSVQAGARRY